MSKILSEECLTSSEGITGTLYINNDDVRVPQIEINPGRVIRISKEVFKSMTVDNNGDIIITVTCNLGGNND